MANRLPLDWDDLRVFIDVARTGNLSQSAQRLRIDHSTASRRVSQLETSLGFALFVRSRAGFRLNELGQRLFARAEAIESAVIALQTEVGGEDDTPSATVRLATMEGIASLYLAPRMVGFRKFAPNIKMELVTSPQVIHVDRREADLFLSFFKPSGQGLISENIGCFNLGLYAAPDYLMQRGTPRDLEQLCEHDFVTYIDDLVRVDAVHWLSDVIKDPNVVFSSNSMIAHKGAAIGGLGLVLLPRFAVWQTDALVPVLPDEAKTTREIWLNVHHDLQFSPRIKAATKFLRTQIASDIASGVL